MTAPTLKLCVFCDSAEKLTGEHVFAKWLSDTGLPLEPVRQRSGPLNRSPRDLGITPPFRLTVKDVCGSCNNGWMSALEGTAKRALSPLLLGTPGVVTPIDHAGVAAWTLKTALVVMLVSSREERASGRGLPPSEYHALYSISGEATPLPRTQFWIGRYRGHHVTAAWATPVVVQVDGLPEPEMPHGYVMTVVVGQVLLQGVRFTSPGLDGDLENAKGFAQLWPSSGSDVLWPAGDEVDDEGFVSVSLGRHLRVTNAGLALRAWRPAIELTQSETDGSAVRLPTPCGKHFVCYPAVLAMGAHYGAFYAFVTSCECGKSYLVETEGDGAHFKMEVAADGIDALAARYNARPGDEVLITGSRGDFVCKLLS